MPEVGEAEEAEEGVPAAAAVAATTGSAAVEALDSRDLERLRSRPRGDLERLWSRRSGDLERERVLRRWRPGLLERERECRAIAFFERECDFFTRLHYFFSSFFFLSLEGKECALWRVPLASPAPAAGAGQNACVPSCVLSRRSWNRGRGGGQIGGTDVDDDG